MTLRFTIRTPSTLITPIKHDDDNIVSVVSLELAMPYDTLTDLIRLVKCGCPFTVAFCPLEIVPATPEEVRA